MYRIPRECVVSEKDIEENNNSNDNSNNRKLDRDLISKMSDKKLHEVSIRTESLEYLLKRCCIQSLYGVFIGNTDEPFYQQDM